MYIFTRLHNYQKQNKGVATTSRTFSTSLFKSDNNVQFTYVNNGPKLTEGEKLALENLITIGNLTKSVFKLPKDSILGTDGLQVYFYCTFWDMPKESLFNAIKYAYTEGILHIFARCGIHSLIPRKNSDLCYIILWRPIVLLNTDLKLLSKVIAGHCKSVMDF